MSTSLVLHGPSGVDEDKSLLSDKLPDLLLLLRSLSVPPHGEELHLDQSEHLSGVGDQGLYDRRNDLANVGDGIGLVTTTVVFIDGFEPADIVVGVRDHVNEDMVGVLGHFTLVLDILEPLRSVTVAVINDLLLGLSLSRE